MNKTIEIQKILNKAKNGLITSKEIDEAGLHRSVLQELVEGGEIYRYARGLYLKKDAWEDDLFLLQQIYNKGVFSHETALYLLGFSDRVPAKYSMTFPHGYHATSLTENPVIVRHTIKDIYDLGMTEITSMFGNQIRVYDLEKTLCDLLRGNNINIELVTDAMKRYARYPERDLQKLMTYAKQLRVAPKVRRYMEVLL